MNLFKKITTGALALTVAAGMAGGALAAVPINDDGNVTVAIESKGVLSVSITDLDLGTLEYKLTEQNASGTIKVGATDLRGNADGWFVTLSGTNFVGNEETLGVDLLDLTGGSVANDNVNQNHPTNAVPLITTAPATLAGSGSLIMSAPANTGAGGYTLTYGANLTVPAGTLVGTYKSILTVTIAGQQP